MATLSKLKSTAASSSLDKPAGSLSARSAKEAGQAAQVLIQQRPKDVSVAQRSYAMAEIVPQSATAIPTAPAAKELVSKFAAQATEEQKKSLATALKEDVFIAPSVKADLLSTPSLAAPSDSSSTLILVGAALLLLGGLK